ncbi:MAG: type II secretion system protein GspE, partial [Gammaproteobacteria bacterium]|nr:type II secretion system protein GspE [Gammaproteobacteria bacterium]
MSDEVANEIAEPPEILAEDVSDGLSDQLRIPFLFARRHGVILTSSKSDKACVSYKEGASATGLRELQRVTGKPLELQKIEDQEFETILSQVYQTDSSDAMQAMEGLGDEFDLFRIAEELPETEDLLEAEDDAPIIRLINALLTEAIKENASDIHIETFEKSLVVRFRIDGVLR